MKSNGLRIEPWSIIHIILDNPQFYFLAYTQCIAYGLIDNSETKTDFFLLFHNALFFLEKNKIKIPEKYFFSLKESHIWPLSSKWACSVE